MPNTNPRALRFIFFTILIDCLGIGIIIPIVPALIMELTNCTISEAATHGGWLIFAFAIMQFLFAPVLGGLSDRFGRRPVLLLSLLGLGFDFIVCALAPTIAWLYGGRIFAGICGASYTTASAYIADISTPEKRSQNFGVIGAAFGIGFTLGPALGSLLGQWGTRAPFYGAAILSLLNFIYGYFVLPESLMKENRRKFDIKRANPFGTFKQLFKHKQVIGLIICFFLIYVAGMAAQSTWSYYTILKFNWDELWVGASITFVGICVAIVQGGLIRIIVPKLGQQKSIYFGLLFYVLGFTLFAFASQGWMMFLFMLPYAMAGITGPTIQSIISAQVPANEQGELQGGLTSLISVSSVIGPLLMTSLFYFFTQTNAPIYFPGAPFMMGALLTLTSLFLAYLSLKSLKTIN
jgi:DHA1 family tetracycline resistance protein-like MFS transporter